MNVADMYGRAAGYGARALNTIAANRGLQAALGGAIVGSVMGAVTASPGSRMTGFISGGLAGAGLGYGAYAGGGALYRRYSSLSTIL